MADTVAEQLLAIRNQTMEATKPQESSTAAPETVQENTTETVEQTEATTEQKVANDGPDKEVETENVEAPKGWDDEPETKVETTSEDFSWVSDLVGEVKTKDELKSKISEYKSKLKEFETQPLAGIPDEFKEIIDVAKTGDWKDYLASQLIDYDKLDPLDEFERDFINRAQNNPKYFTDGKYDHQKTLDAIDALPEPLRELEGSRIIGAEKQLAERQRVAIKAKAEAKLNEAEKSLAQSTNKLGEILPLETYGIKFEQRHSSEIYEGIVNSKLTKKHLGVSYDDLVRSGADMKAITRTITLAEKGEKMIAFKADNKATETKKEILKKVQNVQLNTSGTNPNPEDPGQKVKSPAELLREYITQSKKGL